MQTGPGNVKIPPGSRLVIRCSKKFTALGLDSHNELKAILGPRAEGDRSLIRIVPPGIIWLKMQTSKTAHWSYDYVDRHIQHEPETTPVEIPVQGENLNYHDEMRRIVRDELSKQADANEQETFEDADDFDTGDEDPPTQYEMNEMQEDAEYAASKSVADDPAIPKPPPETEETPPPPVEKESEPSPAP